MVRTLLLRLFVYILLIVIRLRIYLLWYDNYIISYYNFDGWSVLWYQDYLYTYCNSDTIIHNYMIQLPHSSLSCERCAKLNKEVRCLREMNWCTESRRLQVQSMQEVHAIMTGWKWNATVLQSFLFFHLY
jgi:type IV secretory pathway TraG/TraD family ATPase VirD4